MHLTIPLHCSKQQRRMAVKTNKRIEKIRTDFFSTDDRMVMKALEKSKSNGNHTLVEPLLILRTTHQDEDIVQLADEILKSFKISNAEDELLRLLDDEKYVNSRHIILSALWNSGFFPSDSLLKITSHLLSSDFFTALEALTVIENMEEPFDEVQLIESLADTKSFMLQNPESAINDLVMELYNILSGFEQEG